ncbi:uncharacterized protein I206_104015 [Kwoniella pini CBS 10737]|uniref:Myb-like domain-containing protein n=1 Tax=Kwoniella pini CBS 10737 TaxID=1296096 RepID=A0A1B9I2W1_9TREE|nr:uncharacterized protein I206_04410 [Kwoniella pini CBS 10737]OCF49882.1 hypothetical protein I206_04410 [Kwoniella pini CBS 10737]
MSLRLPSQNKFRPTIKPGGQKKAPPVRPPTKTPTSAQNGIATSSQDRTPASSQSTATASSQLKKPLSSQHPSAPTSAQDGVPSALVQPDSPSSKQIDPQSTTTETPVSESSPPKNPRITPSPIPSSQIRAIRSAISPSKAPLTQSSGPSNIHAAPEHIAESGPMSSSQTVPPVLASTAIDELQGETTSTADSSVRSKQKSRPHVATSPKATFAVPPPPANPPKLSLLDAARNHSSDSPSPGQIRRRTPSIASRSDRAPSATPQPQRAPSVVPSQRASSVTPQSRREPSVIPQPPLSSGGAPASGISMPPPSPRQPQRPARPPASRAEPSSSPSVNNASLPPSLGISASQPGMPPSLGTTSTTTISTPNAAPLITREEATALAAAAVESIGEPSNRGPRIRKGKARITKGAAPLAKSSSNMPNVTAQSQRGTARASRPRAIRASTEDGGVSDEEDEEEEEGSEGSLDTATGEKRQLVGEDEDGRPIKRRKKGRAPGVASISLQDIQPDEMVGDKVDEVVITMGDLATVLAAQGKVSKRAIKIDENKRAEQLQKRENARIRAEHTWKRNQIKRRKVRQSKNRDRARRREELGKLGMDESIVSADEDDSEEEYEPEPERLTPESTPEPDNRREISARPDVFNEEDEEYDDEEYNDVPVNNDPNQALFGENESQAGENENDDQDVIMTAEDIAAQEERDADIAAIRAAGIAIIDDVPIVDGGEGEGDDEEIEYDWEKTIEDTEYPDIEGYRREQERERRRMREMQERDDGEIVEIDDETKFINANSFAKYTKPQRWTVLETELFYQVLEETGENYTLMKAYFPGRTIKQLKMKGVRENRSNPDKMTAAILARKPIDKEYLTKSAGYDPTKPWDKEEALFEEAKYDADKLRKLNSIRPHNNQLNEDIVAQQEGDDTFVGEMMEEEKDEDDYEDNENKEEEEQDDGHLDEFDRIEEEYEE